MKNKIFLLVVMLTISVHTFSQVNYHFQDQPGRLALPSTFDGDPGNWQRSHGSPTWGPSTMYMWHQISGGGAGEGIYQDNAFPEVGAYVVKVGIKRTSHSGKIRVFAATGLTPFLGTPVSPGFPPPAASPIPSVPCVLIGEYTLFTSSPFNWLVSASFYNPFPNGQIWIYPEQTTNYGQFECDLDWVTVCRIPEAGITYSSGTLPSGSFYREFYNIGSSFPSGAGVVSNTTLDNTYYQARRYIDLSSNTYVDAGNDGKYFLGEINPGYPCIEMPGSTPEGPGGSPSKQNGGNASGDTSKSLAIQNPSQIGLYPNPTSGKLYLVLPSPAKCKVQIINMIGEVVYQYYNEGTERMEINLDLSLPDGNYAIKVSNADRTIVKQFVLRKQ